MYWVWLPAFRRSQEGSKEKQERKVKNVKTVGKPREAMCDSRVSRRIFTDRTLEHPEQKERKCKSDRKITANGTLPLRTCSNKSTTQEKGQKAEDSECGKS